jgi:hypothetical protein
MDTIQQLEARRLALLEEFRSFRSMRRGTINEQFFDVYLKGKAKTVRRGPYYVLSRKEGDKTVSRRLTTGEALEQARQDTEAHKRFHALCREFEQVVEKLGELERKTEPEKKRLRSGPNKTGR